ncbi:Calnexin [Podosphaera aphanis]|nr:Calnexin [Podosphaera aphanis]
MRKVFSTAALSATIIFASVYAEVNAGAQSILSDTDSTSVAPSSTSSSTPDLPTFTPSNVKAEFVEQFLDGWETLWKPSHATKDVKASGNKDEEWAYVGEFSVEEPSVFKGMIGDKGLVLKSPAAHHAISANFEKKIDNTQKTLVVQYEVKLQKGLECGGAYLKLLRDTEALRQEEFSNVSPYVIMFGPDKCGATNKVHLIINHKNPKTGEYEEKHLTTPPAARIVKTTELYTLIIYPNNTGIIKLNGEQVKQFDLFDDFEPAFNPPKEIDDPKDTKPENWVDEARIPDPAAKKPEDWDEDAPFEIADEEATMPDDWLVDEPLTVPDPDSEKPEDWDDEEDGDWIAPTVANPKCDEVSGCGPWSKPMIKNPAYKGKWTPPYIENPAYKGPWAPQKIKNPAYFEDKTPSNLEPIGAIGFELWTMQSDILFDNIFIGHSVDDAIAFADETFHEKHPHEQLLEIDERTKIKAANADPSSLKFTEAPIPYMREKLDLFITIAKNDPIQAIKFVPEVSGSIVALLLTLIAILIGLFSSGSSSVDKKSSNDAKNNTTEIKKIESVATGSDAGKADSQEKSSK